MNFRLAAVLAGVLLLLGVVFFVSESRSGSGAGQGTPTPKPDEAELQLFSFQAESVKKLEVTKGAQSVVVEKDAGGVWQLPQLNEPADPNRMATASIRLSSLRANRKVAEGGDVAPYGLTTPSMQIVITREDAVHTLLIGNKTPNETGYYVKKPEGSAVFIVSTAFLSDFEKMVTEPPKVQPTPTPRETSSPPEVQTPEPPATPPAAEPTSPLPAPVLPTPGPQS